ncbi:MAG TPA: hypothetical protein PKW94_01385 [Candidatus Dojkabacteria bacterium]|nr:hypothetical protein [Candidatus Dojkabacteria bacterium]
MTKQIERKYEALGFVEALIAIMVVGASSVILMQIAVNTMQGVIQNEKIDTMTQIALEGAETVKEIAKQEKVTGEDLFPNIAGCYVPLSEAGVFTFKKGLDGNFLYLEADANRGEYVSNAAINEEFFRIYCFESYSVGDRYVSGNIIVGELNSEGTITKGNNVKDYSYFTVVNL